MKKFVVLVLLSLIICGCPGEKPVEEIEEGNQEVEKLTYNKNYYVTYNPIFETDDVISYLVLSRDYTFSMSVNTCDGVDFLGGEYFLEEDLLYLVPENYECDLQEEDCDLRGVVFYIKSPTELMIVHGLRCIAEESIFQVEK